MPTYYEADNSKATIETSGDRIVITVTDPTDTITTSLTLTIEAAQLLADRIQTALNSLKGEDAS